MPDEQPSSIKPHIIIIAVIVIVLLVVFLWPKEKTLPAVEPELVITDELEPSQAPIIDISEPEIFEATPTPESVEIDREQEIDPIAEPVYVEPEPVDISDIAIEKALVSIANNNTITNLLVNDSLLQKFVVTVSNLASGEMAPNHRLLTPPEQTFRVYQQADRTWIDPASYKRYTPYVNAMESMGNERLIELYERYKGDMTSTFEEISSNNGDFESVFIRAIDELLDTPEVPMPVEVYTDSVAYKFKDARLEKLSAPQKQLLRTGPDNMRRIKAKLRELKRILEDRAS